MFPNVLMRSAFQSLTRVAWSALPIVLMLQAVPTPAFAQSPVCRAIRRGESATQAARRLTGNGENAYHEWFQIMNPSSRAVPKSQYNRIRLGWRACIISSAMSVNAAHVEESAAGDAYEALNGSRVPEVLSAPAAPAALASADADASDGRPSVVSDVVRRLAGIDLRVLWFCAAMVVPWCGWRMVDDYLTRRKTASLIVRYFVHRFVDEFERPLVRYDAEERPVRSDLRFGARRGRFDILLAPGEGRRYPNLSDHKKNVEYDVARVVRVLADDSFVSGAPYTKAGWIVVPFQFIADRRPSGVSCISSL
jgi:hypothetical protein